MQKILLTLALALTGVTYGQQMPQFSQYMRNQYMINPGAAGMYDFFDVTIGGRMQWLGFDNAPKTTYVYASTPIPFSKVRYNPSIRTSGGPVRNPEIKTGKLKHAMGGMIIADQYGAFNHIKGALTYALHLPLSRDYNLSLGANVGFSNRSFIEDRALTLDKIDPTGGWANDDSYDIYASQPNTNTIDIGAGLYFYSKELFVGISAEQLTRDFIQFGDGVNVDPNMHFHFTAGYKFPLGDNVTLTPSVLVKYMNPSPISIEGNLQIEYKEWLWAGVSYRNTDAVVAMLGLNISRKFRFGYSFDFSVSKFNQHSKGGHEIVLGLMLGR